MKTTWTHLAALVLVLVGVGACADTPVFSAETDAEIHARTSPVSFSEELPAGDSVAVNRSGGGAFGSGN